MFKFVHAADIHLDSPLHKLNSYEGAPVEEFRQATRRAFENLVQLAISEKAAFAVIAGDLYDGGWKDFNTGLYLVSQMKRLRDEGINVFAVSGNHDAASLITRKLRFPDNVHLFSADKPSTHILKELGVAVHGQSFANQAVKKNLARTYPQALDGVYNIGLLHTCATGREGHEPYAPCSLEDLKNKGYEYWALGHVHSFEILENHPPIVFSGNIQGRHIREQGEKGCVLVTVSDTYETELEFAPVDVVRWQIAQVDASGAQCGYDVVDMARRAIEELIGQNNGIPLAVRLQINGETVAHDEILSDHERWVNEIRSAAMDAAGRVWVEKIKIKTSLPSSDQLLEQKDGAVGELLSLFEELADSDSVCRELGEELADLHRKLPSELKGGADGPAFDDPQWIKDMLGQVKPLLVRQLLGKEESITGGAKVRESK
ncbi:MAG: DNA repair exonuclease [Desulfobacteraceae bacterium]|nr:DNA repair exonuclease [Desulfobacteraceae bacterium]